MAKKKTDKKNVEISISLEETVVRSLKIEVKDKGWFIDGRAVSEGFSFLLDAICLLKCEGSSAASDLLGLMTEKMGLNFDDENGYTDQAEEDLEVLVNKVREAFKWTPKPWADGKD